MSHGILVNSVYFPRYSAELWCGKISSIDRTPAFAMKTYGHLSGTQTSFSSCFVEVREIQRNSGFILGGGVLAFFLGIRIFFGLVSKFFGSF